MWSHIVLFNNMKKYKTKMNSNIYSKFLQKITFYVYIYLYNHLIIKRYKTLFETHLEIEMRRIRNKWKISDK